MSGEKIKHEWNRIVKVKGIVVFFFLFGFVGIFFVYTGITDYQKFQLDKKFFIDHENKKVNYYTNYTQYGGYGFRVLYDPPPISIFFSNSSVFQNLYSNIDMSEILKITSSYKGKDLFLKRGLFKDIAGIFFILGSLFMLYMGMASYKIEKCLFRYGSLLIRLAILDLFFVFLLAIVFFSPRVLNLHLSAAEAKIFLLYTCYVLLYLNFFYSAGVFLRVVVRKKPHLYFCVFVFWFFSIAILPEIMTVLMQKKANFFQANEKYDNIKLKELMKFEQEVKKKTARVESEEKKKSISREMVTKFLSTGYEKNSKIEDEINRNVEKILNDYEDMMRIYPATFFTYLSGEISGKGYNGYLSLARYTLALRHNFIKYYLVKRYGSNDSKVVTYVKKKENVFIASSHLPRSFFIGGLLTAFYAFSLLTLSYFILKKRNRVKINFEVPKYNFSEGNTYFILCQDEHYMEGLFAYYRLCDNTICIENLGDGEIDMEVGSRPLLNYYCKSLKVDPARASEYLDILGVENPFSRERDKEKFSADYAQKIYLAVSTAGLHQTVVFKNFIKGKSREMERHFLDIVTHLNKSRKIVLYLSTEIFVTSLSFEREIQIDICQSFKIDPQAVSMR